MWTRIGSCGVVLCGALMGAMCGERKPVSAGAAAEAENSAPRPEVCSLLTVAEIAEATGMKPSDGKPTDYGATATCNWIAPDGFTPIATAVLSQGMPGMGSSSEMAKWRLRDGNSYAGIEFKVSPVEGLGVPAVRNEVEGTGLVAVESAVNGMLLAITTSKLEISKALAAKALARLQ